MVRLLAQTVPCRLVVSPATPGPVSSAPFALLTVFLPGVTVPGASPAVAPWPLRLLWEGSRGCLGWAESPPRARSPQHRGCPTPRLPPPEARSPHRSPTLTHPTNQLCLEARGFISVIFCCSFKTGETPGHLRVQALAGKGVGPSYSLPPPRSPPWTARTRSATRTAASSCSRVSGSGSPGPEPPNAESTSPGLWAPRGGHRVSGSGPPGPEPPSAESTSPGLWAPRGGHQKGWEAFLAGGLAGSMGPVWAGICSTLPWLHGPSEAGKSYLVGVRG